MNQSVGLKLNFGNLNPGLASQIFSREIQSTQKAKPFMKWVGGKTQLLSELTSLMPKSQYERYFEPFLGSGALFFHVNPSIAILNDSNEELINCYKVIRDNVDELIYTLSQYTNSKDHYYVVRAMHSNSASVERAARTIYLNHTCFNGLYRVNQKGEFNTPYGYYTKPKICNEDNLKAVSNVLQNISIQSGGYKESITQAQKGDFIYFDPPYLPVSKFSDFKRYTKDSFYDKDHVELANTFKELDSRGCHVMLSNSDHPLVYELFKSYDIKVVKAKRLINKDATKRGFVNELVIRNYE
ncbi:MAG: DNA adenine methylase [bacterium]